MYGGALFGMRILSAVRNPEASASQRLLMYCMQLWDFQSVTWQVSVVGWVSASQRVRYGRFHCTLQKGLLMVISVA